MANEVTVERQAIQAAAGKLEEAHGVVTALRSKLEGSHAELAAQWKGNASNAFTQVYMAFDADLAKVLNAMQMLQEKMVGTHSTYESTESQQTHTVSKISGMLNG